MKSGFSRLLSVALAGYFLTVAARAAAPARAPASAPNIVYILCDDLGYGDVQSLNLNRGKIKTPHVDRLASQGMSFTDAHSGSSVCTPTRYGVLTGRYSWRSRLQNGVLGGFSPPLIAPGRLTVAELLRSQGYATACLGKWHLGWDWAVKSGGSVKKGAGPANVDYTVPIQHGPTSVGFDYYFGISASLDMAPFVFIENDRVTAIPSVEKTFVRKGPAAPDFEAEEVLPILARKAAAYVKERAAASRQGRPFFLYLPLNSPHAPILPTKEWRGKSGLGDYADFVMETDWAVGEVLRRSMPRASRRTRWSFSPRTTAARPWRKSTSSKRRDIFPARNIAATSRISGKADTACLSSCAGRRASLRARRIPRLSV